MTAEEFLNLAAELRDQLEAVGLGDIGDISNYSFGEEGDVRYPDPVKYVDAMIRAFERHLSTLDRATFATAMANITETLGESPIPETALVYLSENEQELLDIHDPIDLSQTPDLSDLRKELRRLRNDLLESYDPNPDPEAGPGTRSDLQ